MTGSYNTAEAAKKVGTDARTLRRFLRKDPTYRNAGSGGRYSFTDKEIATLKKRFAEWEKKVAMAKRRTPTADPEDYSQPIEIPPMTPALRMQIREQELRLDARLREVGLHLSQLHRKEWEINEEV